MTVCFRSSTLISRHGGRVTAELSAPSGHRAALPRNARGGRPPAVLPVSPCDGCRLGGGEASMMGPREQTVTMSLQIRPQPRTGVT